MSKRIKINFETVNGGKYEIIPKEKIAETNARIKENMKKINKTSGNVEKELGISDVMRLLSDDVCYEASELKTMQIGNDMKLVRDGVAASNFEMGFLYARKLILDELKK